MAYNTYIPSKLGQYCLDINITPESLLSDDLPKLERVTNGVVIELCAFVRCRRLQNDSVGNWLRKIGIDHSDINACVWNLYEHRQTLANSKKKEGLALGKSSFDPNEWCPAEQTPLDMETFKSSLLKSITLLCEAHLGFESRVVINGTMNLSIDNGTTIVELCFDEKLVRTKAEIWFNSKTKISFKETHLYDNIDKSVDTSVDPPDTSNLRRSNRKRKLISHGNVTLHSHLKQKLDQSVESSQEGGEESNDSQGLIWALHRTLNSTPCQIPLQIPSSNSPLCTSSKFVATLDSLLMEEQSCGVDIENESESKTNKEQSCGFDTDIEKEIEIKSEIKEEGMASCEPDEECSSIQYLVPNDIQQEFKEEQKSGLDIDDETLIKHEIKEGPMCNLDSSCLEQKYDRATVSDDFSSSVKPDPDLDSDKHSFIEEVQEVEENIVESGGP